jgi:hypothetical protein
MASFFGLGPMFAPKAKILPVTGALARRAPRVGFNLTRTHKTSLNRPARETNVLAYLASSLVTKKKLKTFFCQWLSSKIS